MRACPSLPQIAVVPAFAPRTGGQGGISPIDRAAIPAYAAVLTMATFITLVVTTTLFEFDFRHIGAPVVALIVLAGSGARIRYRTGAARLGSGLQAIALFVAVSMAAPLCAVIVASTNLPLSDAWLAELDRTLFFGFERAHAVSAVMEHPLLFALTRTIYHSLIWQPIVLIALLFFLNEHRRGWTLVFAWALTLGVVLAVFPFFPAAGQPPYFLDFEATFNGARDGTLYVLGQKALTGIITFPSFHAGASVLLAWGFARVPRIGWPFVLLNTAMIATALIAGHYLIDLVVGAIIALICIAVSVRLQDRLARIP